MVIWRGLRNCLLRRLVYWLLLLFSLFGTSFSAFAAGECDGRQQPLTVSISASGEYFLQETRVASYRELNEKLAAMGFADCIYIRMDEDTPWSVAKELLFPLGVVGDFRMGSIMNFGGEASRSPILLWVARGYQGKVKL